MKASSWLLASFLWFAPQIKAADTPTALAEELRDVFAKGEASALANSRVFTIITGDIPIGRHRPGDPDGLAEAIPRHYEIASVKILTPAEARSIEEKGYARGIHGGYISVDFVRRENSVPKPEITAFRRYYPYEQTGNQYSLTSEK